MKKENFFTALRFITLAQNGDFNITKGKEQQDYYYYYYYSFNLIINIRKFT